MNEKSVEPNLFKINRIIAYMMLVVGLASLAFSMFNASYMFAFAGLALSFWGALLLYIAPSKYVKLDLLNATLSSSSTNIQKIITNSNLNQEGIYLPPKYLKDIESSLIFLPLNQNKQLPDPATIDEEKLFLENSGGLLLTPPGLDLSKLLEKKLKTSFAKVDLYYIRQKLPKLLVEGMEMAEKVEIKTEGNRVILEMTNNIFKGLYEEKRKLGKLHEMIGDPLCSAIACALSKATGRPIRIEKGELSKDGNIIKIQYCLVED